MPTYDYQCDACSHRFEHYQSMKDAALKKCPKCGKLALRRLIGTGGAVIFKGSGFYQTDYRSESYKKAAEADKTKPESTTENTNNSKAASADASTPASTKPVAESPKANNHADGTKKPARRIRHKG